MTVARVITYCAQPNDTCCVQPEYNYYKTSQDVHAEEFDRQILSADRYYTLQSAVFCYLGHFYFDFFDKNNVLDSERNGERFDLCFQSYFLVALLRVTRYFEMHQRKIFKIQKVTAKNLLENLAKTVKITEIEFSTKFYLFFFSLNNQPNNFKLSHTVRLSVVHVMYNF